VRLKRADYFGKRTDESVAYPIDMDPTTYTFRAIADYNPLATYSGLLPMQLSPALLHLSNSISKIDQCDKAVEEILQHIFQGMATLWRNRCTDTKAWEKLVGIQKKHIYGYSAVEDADDSDASSEGQQDTHLPSSQKKTKKTQKKKGPTKISSNPSKQTPAPKSKTRCKRAPKKTITRAQRIATLTEMSNKCLDCHQPLSKHSHGLCVSELYDWTTASNHLRNCRLEGGNDHPEHRWMTVHYRPKRPNKEEQSIEPWWTTSCNPFDPLAVRSRSPITTEQGTSASQPLPQQKTAPSRAKYSRDLRQSRRDKNKPLEPDAFLSQPHQPIRRASTPASIPSYASSRASTVSPLPPRALTPIYLPDMGPYQGPIAYPNISPLTPIRITLSSPPQYEILSQQTTENDVLHPNQPAHLRAPKHWGID